MVSVMLRQNPKDVPVQLFYKSQVTGVPVDLMVKGATIPGTLPVVEPISQLIEKFLSKKPFYIAHRLGGHDFPEHTLQGLQASIGAGYKAVEFSTYQTKDGVFIGSHDWTTERTTGVRHEIWNTDWLTIQTLNQAAGKIIRLEDMLSALPPDVVVFLDHKDTSSRANPTAAGLRSEATLFEKLEQLLPNPQQRIVWKVFAEASSAERARQRGYKINCMLYPATMAGADFSRWDILGMEWNADQTVWDHLKTTGKPTVAHIIYNQTQAQTALGRGADGLMVSVPTKIYP